jgi:hypothetical protein
MQAGVTEIANGKQVTKVTAYHRYGLVYNFIMYKPITVPIFWLARMYIEMCS